MLRIFIRIRDEALEHQRGREFSLRKNAEQNARRYVYPKGIFNFLFKNGFKVKYCRGNLNSLKNEVATGNPVIAMIKIRPDKNWLHYVPVVGYDGQNIFIAESLAELSNCNEPHYNRRIPAKEFKKLWNTAMPKMPLYANTFFTVER